MTLIYDIYDVVVAGAGLAGISAAKALQERGWRTICCDRRSFPRHKVCGEFLSPEAKSILDELGLLSSVELLQPERINHAKLYMGQGRPIHLPLPDIAYGISRYRLDAALHMAAASVGVQIATRTLITRIRRDDDRYLVEARQGGERRCFAARAVIGAWGSQRVQTDASIVPDSSEPVYIGLKSHYTNLALKHAVELYTVPGGYVGVAPIDEGKANVAALIRNDRVQGPESILEKLEFAARGNRLLRSRLQGAMPVETSQASVHPIVLGKQPRLWDESEQFPLIGDAGLMIPPLCGDGMSIALYTARECAYIADRYLRGLIDLQEWRYQYEQAVHRKVHAPLRWGRLAHRCVVHPWLPRVLGPAIQYWPGISRRIVRATRLNI
jgi:flavin-dependent dehydrogenase